MSSHRKTEKESKSQTHMQKRTQREDSERYGQKPRGKEKQISVPLCIRVCFLWAASHRSLSCRYFFRVPCLQIRGETGRRGKKGEVKPTQMGRTTYRQLASENDDDLEHRNLPRYNTAIVRVRSAKSQKILHIAEKPAALATAAAPKRGVHACLSNVRSSSSDTVVRAVAAATPRAHKEGKAKRSSR